MGVEQAKIRFGTMELGRGNLITDVPGVTVGHCTKTGDRINTGVTAILPHSGNLFRKKVVAATHVINGFGKSAGLIQVQELGTIESPIVLTNTFSVGTAINAVIKYMLAQNEDIGVTTGTINPLVMECNDSFLNDIRGMHVTEEDVVSAIEHAGVVFSEGSVGAGRGMSCYGLKGGIGSSSRIMEIEGGRYTVGSLLLTNFGAMRDLVVCGDHVGERFAEESVHQDIGSVIVVLATDIPMSASQLLRAARRAQNGLARTGSITGNGSGEIVVMFTTANTVEHYPTHAISHIGVIHENSIDMVFRAVVECVEESVISSMLHAEPVIGPAGNERASLKVISKLYTRLKMSLATSLCKNTPQDMSTNEAAIPNMTNINMS